MRVYNFSAGPSTMPEEVLKRIQAEFMDFEGSGMNPMEMSHRGKPYDNIHSGAIAALREVMGIPDDYYILLLQGGATQQFEAIPMNLLGKNNKADYVNTGHWATQAIKLAKPYGDIAEIATSADKDFTYIPNIAGKERPDANYLHITYNNTIRGTRFTAPPKTKLPLIADISSMALSEPLNVKDFALLYAGAQKNIACAGVTIVIVKKELVDNDCTVKGIPQMYRWKAQAEKDSLLNTPPTFIIYVLLRMLQDLKAKGGVEGIYKVNIEKAKRLYDCIDNSRFYSNPVNPADRSLMNVIFRTPGEATDALFVKEAEKKGIIAVKGHKSAGGLRASIYNAMTLEGVDYLVKFMKEFALANK